METATQILEMTAQLLRPEESVTIGVLPPEGGMTLQVAGGAADARYLDGSSRRSSAASWRRCGSFRRWTAGKSYCMRRNPTRSL